MEILSPSRRIAASLLPRVSRLRILSAVTVDVTTDPRSPPHRSLRIGLNIPRAPAAIGERTCIQRGRELAAGNRREPAQTTN